MNIFRISSLLLFIQFIISACVSSEKVNYNLDLSIEKREINAWLNLMPGTSPGKFHITGEITLKNKGSDEIKNIELNNITVYANDEVVYTLTPYFSPKSKKDNYNLGINEDKIFSFGSDNVLKIDERLEKNNKIDIRLEFISEQGSIYFRFYNIEVERAY